MYAAANSVTDNLQRAIARSLDVCKSGTQPTINATQSINVSCTPAPIWYDSVYNGRLCSRIRDAPYGTYSNEQMCNACYACCATDNQQSAVVTYTTNCIGTSAYTTLLLSKLREELATNPLLTDALRVEIMSIFNTDLNAKLQSADQTIISLQSIRISGVGVVQKLRQTVAINVIYDHIISDQMLQRLADIIADFLDKPPTPIPTPITIPKPTPLPITTPIPTSTPPPLPIPTPTPLPIPTPITIPTPSPLPIPTPITIPKPIPTPTPIAIPIPLPLPIADTKKESNAVQNNGNDKTMRYIILMLLVVLIAALLYRYKTASTLHSDLISEMPIIN